MAADASAARSILVFKHDEDKIVALDSHKLLVGAGVPADTANFNEYISKNMKLYEVILLLISKISNSIFYQYITS